MTGAAFDDYTGDRHWDFAYNTRSELTGGDRRVGTTLGSGTFMTPGNYDYTYDPIGNRTNSNVDEADPGMTYTRNSVNQYTATAGSVAESFTYDDDGNLKTDATYGYTWDAENRLIRIEPVGTPANGSEMLEFEYDYMGRRVEKVYSVHDGEDWVESSRYRFVYDQWNVVMVLSGVNNTISRRFTWGLDLSGLSGDGSASGIHSAGGIGGLLVQQLTTNAYAFLYDGNGNVVQIIKQLSLPNVFWNSWGRFEYDPYGNIIGQSGIMAAPGARTFAFSTKWLDTELAGPSVTGAVGPTGLYYYGYRYYSPRLGRWISRDPIGELGGPNVYSQVKNDPIRLSDPLGKQHDALYDDCKAECDAIYNDCLDLANKTHDACMAGARSTDSACRAECNKIGNPLGRWTCLRVCDSAWGAMYAVCREVQGAMLLGCEWARSHCVGGCCTSEDKRRTNHECDECFDWYTGPCPGGTCF